MAPPPAGTRARVLVRYRRLDARRVEADIDVLLPDGDLLVRALFGVYQQLIG